MNFKLLENTKEISEAFITRFTLSWEESQIEMKDFIMKMEEKNYPVDFAFYEQSLFWDRMGPKYPYVSMDEAFSAGTQRIRVFYGRKRRGWSLERKKDC